MKPLRAAVYCRISTDEDTQQHSLEYQKNYYESYIQTHPNYVFSGMYVDAASGTNCRKRLQFTKMIQDCRKGKIDIIFAKSISRFARNSLDFLTTIRELKALGVDVYFETEKILLSRERDEFRMTTLAAVAQEESFMKSRSIKWSLNVGFTTGTSKLANRSCYGYTNDGNGGLVIDPESGETVKMIFRLYLDGYSLSGIGKELHRLRITSPTGKETWTACAIDKILSNEKYVGVVLLQKTYVPDVLKGVQVKNNGEQARYLYENNHVGIITQETFDAVQEEKKRRSNCTTNEKGKQQRKNVRYSSGNSISGKIQCAECGRNFRRITTHSGEIVWRCASRVEGSKKCNAETIKQSDIDATLKKRFGEDYNSHETFRKIESVLIDGSVIKIIATL